MRSRTVIEVDPGFVRDRCQAVLVPKIPAPIISICSLFSEGIGPEKGMIYSRVGQGSRMNEIRLHHGTLKLEMQRFGTYISRDIVHH